LSVGGCPLMVTTKVLDSRGEDVDMVVAYL
jgi:hypothetical protein